MPVTKTVKQFSDIDRDSWQRFLNTLSTASHPFFQYDFLSAIEQYAANAEHGWQASHIVIEEDDEITGFMPLYAKTHSRGEFVFDYAWANAFHQHGLDYYPKLLNAIPLTPCPNTRLLAANESIKQQLIETSVQLAEEQSYSSIHSLFLNQDEQALLEEHNFLVRQDCLYRWQNQGFENFDQYLASLRKNKRKNIRQERRKITESPVTTVWLTGADITDSDWPDIYQMYCSSYWVRGQQPYLPIEFFKEIASNMPEQFLCCVAKHQDKIIAAAFYYRDSNTLYGRHWGADNNYHSLHFELCYYQGIEYCIRHHLQHFDAGVQGEHKHSRGFEATVSRSAHYIVHPEFRQAIANFLDRETVFIDKHIEHKNERSAFKSTN